MIPLIYLPYQNNNLLFLEDLILELEKRNIYTEDLLYRASEQDKLEKILKFGTDRGGFSERKIWPYSNEIDKEIMHEDVIYATTEDEIRKGEQDQSYSTSLKKFSIINSPLFLIYDSKHFIKLKEKQYVFSNPKNKRQPLLAVVYVKKIPEIEGWFSNEAELFYRSLVKPIKNGTIVEIGSWKGRSISYIGKVCMVNNTRLYCIDWWNGSSDEFNDRYKQMLEKENVELTFRYNLLSLGINAVHLKTTSLEASQYFKDEKIDLVFLDGSHDYSAVKADAEVWFKKLINGGILAGHDFSEKHHGVIRAIEDFVDKNKLKLSKGAGTIWYIRK